MGSSCENKTNNLIEQETIKNLNDVPVYSSYIADVLVQENYKINRIKPNRKTGIKKNLCIYYFERTPEIEQRIKELADIRKINTPKKEE